MLMSKYKIRNVSAGADNMLEMMKKVMMGDSKHDFHQMGGTIVMGSEGKIHFIHQTTESTDRPPAEKVFKAFL